MVWSLGVEQAGLGEEVSEQSWCYLCYLHLLPLCSLLFAGLALRPQLEQLLRSPHTFPALGP